jgi:hypothetical protein
VAAVVAYIGLCQAAEVYGDLLNGLVAAHRTVLYRAVGFPSPASTTEERKLGQLMSDYLENTDTVSQSLSWVNEEEQPTESQDHAELRE